MPGRTMGGQPHPLLSARLPRRRPRSSPSGRAGLRLRLAFPGLSTPTGYTIGTDDVLTVVFWQDKEMSGDVVVRPDGKVTLPSSTTSRLLV